MPMNRDEFKAKAEEIADQLRNNMVKAMLKAFDHMTPKEIDRHHTESKPWLIVRAIGMAVGDDTVDKTFNVESIKSTVPAVRRILNKSR